MSNKETIVLHDPHEVEVKMVQTPIWKHILWAVVTVFFLWALAQIPNTLIVFGLAWLFSYLLNPVVDALQGKKIGPIKHCSRGMAVGIVTGILVGLMLAAGSWMMPHLTDQVQRLLSIQNTISDPMALPVALREKVEPILAKVPVAYREEAMERASGFIQDGASKIGLWVSKAIGWLGSFLGQLLSGLFLVMTAFLVSLYMLMNWHGMGDTFLQTLPKQYRDEVLSLSLKMNVIFGGYLKATILTSIACMIATFVSLWILTWVTGHDFPYKGLVAFVAGLAYPVPVVGIIATSILGGVLGYLPENNLGFGLAVLVTINVVNIIIDRTVQPRLMSDAIGVSELFVMFAAFAGGEVAGIWGMLLGIPVAAMGKALFEWFHTNFLVVEEIPEFEEELQESASVAPLSPPGPSTSIPVIESQIVETPTTPAVPIPVPTEAVEEHSSPVPLTQKTTTKLADLPGPEEKDSPTEAPKSKKSKKKKS